MVQHLLLKIVHLRATWCCLCLHLQAYVWVSRIG